AEQKTIINNTQVKVYGALQWKDQKEASNILHLSDPHTLEQLQPGQFILKAGRHESDTRQFPSKFAVPKVAFGKGVLINAYMNSLVFGSLQDHLKQQVNISLLPEAVCIQPNSDPIIQQNLRHLSFKSFSIHGSKPH
ncbi:MAG: hypothetical protein MJK04_24555, partial [Psychrosphaera sp.]|nr:hypothetical protein [Psychrosphaera sp.]